MDAIEVAFGQFEAFACLPEIVDATEVGRELLREPFMIGIYWDCLEGHDHDDPTNLEVIALNAVPLQFPWLDQFFGLPTGTDLVVEMGERVSVPVLWRPERIEPIAKSYVATLNAAAR